MIKDVSGECFDMTVTSPEFRQIREHVDKLKGRRDQLTMEIAQAEEDRDYLERRHDDAVKAKALHRMAAKETQKNIEFQISTLISMALASVFPDPYEFKVEFVERRGKTEADLLFFKDGHDMGSILFSGGGGPKEIASFSLRCVFWNLNRTRPVLLLDEPFKFINDAAELDSVQTVRNLQKKCAQMLIMLIERLHLQCIVVSNLPELVDVASKVFKVSQKDGVSSIEVVKDDKM
jgi:hypothetical protein